MPSGQRMGAGQSYGFSSYQRLEYLSEVGNACLQKMEIKPFNTFKNAIFDRTAQSAKLRLN